MKWLRGLFHYMMAEYHRGTAYTCLHHGDDGGCSYHWRMAEKHEAKFTNRRPADVEADRNG